MDTGYLWDEKKRAEVLAKHSITYSQAVQACEDQNHLLQEDPQGNPDRFMIVGRTEAGRLMQVICAEEDLPLIRFITAFDAEAFWRNSYER